MSWMRPAFSLEGVLERLNIWTINFQSPLKFMTKALKLISLLNFGYPRKMKQTYLCFFGGNPAKLPNIESVQFIQTVSHDAFPPPTSRTYTPSVASWFMLSVMTAAADWRVTFTPASSRTYILEGIVVIRNLLLRCHQKHNWCGDIPG